MTWLFYGAEAEPWTPAAYGGTLHAWYDPSDASKVTLTSGLVSQLRDKSGNARHVAQDRAGERPALASLNGRNALSLSGGECLYRDPNWMYANGNVYVFLAMKVPSQSQLGMIVGEVHSSDTDQNYVLGRIQTVGDTDLKAQIRNNAGTVLSNFALLPSVTDNVAKVVGMKDTGTNLSGYTDAGGLTAGSPDAYSRSGTMTLQRFCIGAKRRSVALDGLVGLIGEMVFVNSGISSGDIDRMVGYLAHRWGTTGRLPGGHPYKTNPPTL